MNMKSKILFCAATASLLAFAASAQDTQSPQNSKTGVADYNRARLTQNQSANRLNDAAKASDVIGMTVKNYQDEKLGKVEDLAVDVESGRIVQVILSPGGTLIRDSLSAVPPGALHHDAANKVLHLDADKEKLKGAPKFDNAKWDESTQPNRVMEVYGYYGTEPYFIQIPKASNFDSDRNALQPRNTDGTVNTDAPRSVEKARNEEIVRNAETTTTASGRNPNGIGHVQKASKLMGAPVKNMQNEKLGKVENMLVDLPAGRIVAVVVSSGGFLGMGDELSAIPPTAMRVTADSNDLQLDTSKETLTAAPHFKSNQWPDFREPTYTSSVYSAYKVEPYFTTDPTKDVDNARQNVRDRKDETLTPFDQGNSKADVATTTQIRKEITGARNMSANARNVKIITIAGRVTLRGPVNSEEEKSVIEEIARRNNPSGTVDNQLEVKARATQND